MQELAGLAVILAIGAIGLAVLVMAFWSWGRVPSTLWVRASCVTSTFQFNVIPIFGIYPSVCILSALAAAANLSALRVMLRQRWFIWVLALFALQAASGLWATEKRVLVRYLIYQLPFVFLVVGAARWTLQDRDAVLRVLRIALGCVGVEAVLVILFRLSPGAEAAFLLSPVARVFISTNSLEEIFAPGVTIWDPTKSGGFLIYPNIASAFLGVAACMTWQLAKCPNGRWLRGIAVLDWLAVFCTGSKAGAIAAFLIPALIALPGLARPRQRRISDIGLIVACLVAAAGAAMTPLAYDAFVRSGFGHAASGTLASREALWAFGREQFANHPWSGLGFGGWEASIPRIGSVVGMPPHNAFVRLWSDSGLLAPMLGALFVIDILLWAWSLAQRGDEEQRALAMGLFGALLWLFFQAQGENFGLFGEEHIKPLVTVLCGLLAADQWRSVASRVPARGAAWAVA